MINKSFIEHLRTSCIMTVLLSVISLGLVACSDAEHHGRDGHDSQPMDSQTDHEFDEAANEREHPSVAETVQAEPRMTRRRIAGVWVSSALSMSDYSDENKAASKVHSHDLMPLKSRTATFKKTEGDDEGQKSILTLTNQGDGIWSLHQEGEFREALQQDDDGAILLISSRVKQDDSLLQFTPAVAKLPATLEPGKPVTVKANVRVTALSDGDEKASGSYSSTIELIGKCRMKVPAGEFDTYMVRTTEKFSFDLATVVVVTSTAYVLDVGPIYRRQEKTVNTLGLFPETTVTTFALDE